MNILIVDDDREDLILLKEGLRSLDGIHLFMANNMEEMHYFLKSKDIDLAILDVNLGMITGYEVARELKENYKGLTIAIMTGSSLLFNSRTAMESGAETVLPKTSKFSEVCEYISNKLKTLAGA